MASITKWTFKVKGMTCLQCEKTIENCLSTQASILRTSVNYKSNTVQVTYDPTWIKREEIAARIEQCGYEVVQNEIGQQKNTIALRGIGAALLLVALYLVIPNTIGFNTLPQVQASMGYGMLFLVGLLTSIHCIAMCGGISLSQSIKVLPTVQTKNVYHSSVLYNLGRVISYTTIGAVVGALGEVITLSGPSKGLVSFIAGTFMIIMGLNLMGSFPFLKKISIHFPPALRMMLLGKDGDRGPFVVGLLNGFMPCGPLQTMQLYALGTGSALTGALSMLAFSVGTVPLMLGLGALSTKLSRNFTKNMLKVSALLILVMGVIMFQRGMALSGLVIGTEQAQSEIAQTLKADGTIVNGIQTLNLKVGSRSYPSFVIKKNLPTKVNFQVTQGNLNSCNDAIVIPEYGIEKVLQVGDNWIEFTPTESGEFAFSCWMGMISSQITVVE